MGFAEYLYIILVSSLFFYAAIKLADASGINRDIFYALLLGPFVIVYGLRVGTELLSLALLMLFAVSLVKKEPWGAAYISLAFLARYTNFVFIPLMLVYRQPRKILIAVLIFILPAAAWLAYNYAATGSMLTSLADHYALGVIYREYIDEPVRISDFLIALNYLIPLSIAGLLIKRKSLNKCDIAMLAFAMLAIISFWMIPLREPRYLFNLILPAAYFSYFAARNHPWSKYLILSATIVCLAAAAMFQPQPAEHVGKETYLGAISSLDGCAVASNAWPLLNYYGMPSESAPQEDMLDSMVQKGYRLVFFAREKEPEYAHNRTFLRSFPIIAENEIYIILGDRSRCAPKANLNATYVARLDAYLKGAHNETVETAPCKILFPALGNSVCKIVK